MANIITVPPSPQPWETLSGVISQFTDRYTKNRQEQEAMDLQRQQLAQTGQYQDRMAGVSEGQLKIQQEAQRLASDQQAYLQAKERWGAAYDQAIAPMLSSGRPEDFQAAQANMKALVEAHPEFAAYAGATALRLQNGPLPADQERATTQDTFTNAAGQVNRYVSGLGGGQDGATPPVPSPPAGAGGRQTITVPPGTGDNMPRFGGQPVHDNMDFGAGRPPVRDNMPEFEAPPVTVPNPAFMEKIGRSSPSAGTPTAPPVVNPQVMDIFHKRNFANQGMSQQSMANLEAQDPRAGGYDKFLRREAGDLTTAAQDKAAATQITTTGMQEAGATKRAGMAAAAKNAAPPAIEPGTPLYGVAQDLSSGHLTFEQFTKLYGRGANPLKQAIYQTAKQINPDFDPSSFELGYKFAGNKGVRQQVAAADNALRMIPEAIAISDKATRLGPTGLNKLIMTGGVMMGGKKYTDARTLQKAFGDEISGALGFGGATDMTRELGLSMADLNFSSGNFRSAMEILDTFLKNKRGTLVNQMGQYGGTVDKFSAGVAAGAGAPSSGEAWAQKHLKKP